MSLGKRILLPLASPEDARRTTTALREVFPTAPEGAVVLPLHIIEKGGGSLDKVSVEAQKEQAEELFIQAIPELEAAGFEVEPQMIFATDVVVAICEAALEHDATAIVFLPRAGGTLSKLLAGNLSDRLITQSPVPVTTLPQPAD